MLVLRVKAMSHGKKKQKYFVDNTLIIVWPLVFFGVVT